MGWKKKQGPTTHAAFFDYDLDGDLDCYILNNSFRQIKLGYNKNIRTIRDPKVEGINYIATITAGSPT